jgi:peptidoglycan/xylan/chitin deacetylase (PgdA/CDA1 family)
MKNHAFRILIGAIASQCIFVHTAAFAGDVTTVPWNGYPGAVSFTFDDALVTQLDNVVPALKQRNIHATFFIYDVGNTFTNNKSRWIAAAQDGNELANHTVTHADFSKSINASYEMTEMATRLRNASPVIEVSTFAYPYCAIGYESVVQSENIIGRGCSFNPPFNPLQWNAPPKNWNNVGAIYVGDDASATGPTKTAIDAAMKGGWIVTLNHGVGGDWVPVSKANMFALFDQAIKNGLWIGTYKEVAAYWRAGLTMDTVKAVKSNSEWNLAWKSPHSKMPKTVPIKIKPSESIFGKGYSVVQQGKAIAANPDGSYTIDFMLLSLKIQASTGSSSSVSSSSVSSSSSSSIAQTAYSSATIPGTIQMENYDKGGEGVAYHDADVGNSGNVYRQDDVDLDALGASNHTLGWTQQGEWIEYSVQIPKSGSYAFTARVASGGDASSFHLELDGTRVTDTLRVPNTGNWTTYQDLSGTTTSLPSGLHVLRLVVDGSYCNIDQIQFLETTTRLESIVVPWKSPSAIKARQFELNGKRSQRNW